MDVSQTAVYGSLLAMVEHVAKMKEVMNGEQLEGYDIS